MAASVETDVAVLKTEIANNKELVAKLAATTDKIGEVSAYMAKILAVHDARLAAAEDKAEQVKNETEERRLDLVADFKDLAQRLDAFHKSLSEELVHLEDRLTTKIEEISKDITSEQDKVEDRVRSLEKWRWMLVGGGVVLGFIIGKLPFFTNVVRTIIN